MLIIYWELKSQTYEFPRNKSALKNFIKCELKGLRRYSRGLRSLEINGSAI